MKKTVLQVIFWGSIWGIAEATLGFVLHWAAIAMPGLPGFLMFPIAFFFMGRAVQGTGLPEAAFYSSVVASMLKFTDFLVPGHDAIRIVNPALSILFEGIAVFAVIRYLSSAQMKPIKPVHAFAMGFVWRILFLMHLWVISLFGLPAALVTNGLGSSLRFLFGESLINAVIIILFAYLYNRINRTTTPIMIRPAYAYAAMAAAVISQSLL